MWFFRTFGLKNEFGRNQERKDARIDKIGCQSSHHSFLGFKTSNRYCNPELLI